MNISELIKTRRSIREYKPDPVPKKLIEEVVEAGIWAPSSMNRQPWRFVVVTNDEKRKFLADEAKKELGKFLNSAEGKAHWGVDVAKRFAKRAQSPEDMIFYDAPAIIFIIQRIDVGDEFDFGLAAENMMLFAHDKGLGTCPIGLSKYLANSPESRKILGMKKDEKLILSLTLGYPNEEAEVTEREMGVVEWVV
jgi:nitroreductase